MTIRAFTLIELLVVIAIIAVLAGLLLAGAGPLRQAAKRNATSAVCQAVQQALHVRAAALGGLIEPVEHPLAGSREPRRVFVRANGGAVAVNGEALRGVELSRLPAGDQSRLLLGDDRTADPATPHLYGMSRTELTVLGAGLTEVTHYRLLPLGTGMITDPSVVGRIVAPNADGPEVSKVVATALGKAGNEGDLAKLNALWSPPDDDPANRLANGRVYRAPTEVEGTFTVDGTRYRLRGTGVYDAWGNEILYSLGDKDAIRLTSAGRDGHFRWHPGDNGTLQTAADSTSASGDDRDASQDNIRIGR